MRLEQLVIVFLLVGAAIVGSYSYIHAVADPYGVVVNDSGYADVYDATTNISESISDAWNSTVNIEIDTTTSFFTGVGAAFSILKNVIKAPFVIGFSIVNSFSNNIGLPPWFVSLILSVFAVFIVFAIIAFIQRWNP